MTTYFPNTNYKSEPQSLIQFLGLKDKNGKKIFFGDILKDEFGNLLTPVIEIENAEHIFYFKPINHLKTKLHIGCKSTYSNTLEIIGNFEDLEKNINNTNSTTIHLLIQTRKNKQTPCKVLQ